MCDVYISRQQHMVDIDPGLPYMHVGMVNRCGYDGQQIYTIYGVVGHATQFEAY